MTIKTVVMSSAHGKFVRGAKGYIDEVDESRRVVTQVAADLRRRGVEVTTFNDDTSKTVAVNLNTIVNFHNGRPRHDLDVSIHFNAYAKTTAPRGAECLYRSQRELSKQVATAIAKAGKLIDRGPKHRTNLSFLNRTKANSILVEVAFVDSLADSNAYKANFSAICRAIAEAIKP